MANHKIVNALGNRSLFVYEDTHLQIDGLDNKAKEMAFAV